MKVYVVWHVDFMDGQIAASLFTNNAPHLKKLTQNLHKSADDLKAWVSAKGGETILCLCQMGAFGVEADHMTDFPQVRQKMIETCENFVSLGIGIDLDEAQQALKFAMKNGGNQIALFTKEMQDTTTPNPESVTPLENLLNKGEDTENGPPVPFARDPMQNESRDAPSDLPDVDPKDGGKTDDPHEAIMSALLQIKSQASAIEQLKLINPTAYEAVKEIVRAMILMADGMGTKNLNTDP